MKKSNAIEFTAIKETDNIETVKGLNNVLKLWLDSLSAPFEVEDSSIENFEFKSRDGFSANRHNHGGLDLIAITSISSLMGSGEHVGTEIEAWVQQSWNDTYAEIEKDYPNLDTDSETFYDLVYENCSDSYSTVAWRVRVMYEGNGVLCIHAGYDKDAPYFRWNGKPSFEKEVKFKSLSDLDSQLASLTKEVIDSQNDTKKNAK